MGRYEDHEGAGPKKGPHPHYESNLARAKKFMERMDKKVPKGVLLKITGSPELPESCLVISFSVPGAQIGTYAAVIFLHQDSKVVSNEVEGRLNNYVKEAKAFWDKQKQKVVQLEMPNAVGQ